MKRRREQLGTVYAKSGMWYVRYSDFRVTNGQLERKRLAKQLGCVSDITKKEARSEAKVFLAKINQPALTPETAVTFTAFVESVYLPHSERRIRPSTYRGYKVLWREIKPFCEGLWTRDVRTRHVQAILEAMAKTDRFNVNSLKHIKSFLSGIFRLADQQGYYEGANPVRETSLPRVRQADETYAYSLEEVLTLIDAVPEPASTLIAAAAFTGARRGELRGMFWENYQEGELLIARSIWNGITTDPKSRKSKAPIPIIPKLAAKLEAHRSSLGKPKTGPVFPNRAGNAVDPDSLLHRLILPALEVCEICSKPELEHGKLLHKYERNKVLPEWRGWHAFRRGLATNLNRLGVDDSVIQRILRHSNVAVTQACYIKTATEDAKAAMQKLETALNDTYVTPRQTDLATKGVM
ncbi:MAG: site-specific integrase [Acidobacteriia bacterium]|nr:site-specific integrase [Terriglobia bacterium]